MLVPALMLKDTQSSLTDSVSNIRHQHQSSPEIVKENDENPFMLHLNTSGAYFDPESNDLVVDQKWIFIM